MACFKGEGKESQSDLLASAVFSDSFSLIYSVYPGAMFLIAFPELH